MKGNGKFCVTCGCELTGRQLLHCVEHAPVLHNGVYLSPRAEQTFVCWHCKKRTGRKYFCSRECEIAQQKIAFKAAWWGWSK